MASSLYHATGRQKRLATRLAFFSLPLSGFITDIYLPSFPSMAQQLRVPEKEIQLTLTVFLLSYGLAQLFVGSLLDSIGRYRASLSALAAIVVTSLLISMASDIRLIVFFRMLQGIAAAFLVVAKRAFFMDLYEGAVRKRLLSYFSVVWSCGPIIAPFLGGYLQKGLGWQSSFYFLALYAVVLLLAEILYSGETLPQPKPFRLGAVVGIYRGMLGNREFVLGIIILGLSYSIAMVFNVAGPFVIENHFHSGSVVVGYCTLLLGFAWMLGGIISRRLLQQELRHKVLAATFCQLAFIAALLLIGLFAEQLVLLILFGFLVHTCSGFLFNIFFTNSMLQFPNNSGIAGGLVGGLVYLITSVASFFVSTVGDIHSQQDLAVRYLAGSLLLLLAAQLKIGKRRLQFARAAS